jgi:hypothetical protein
MRIAGMAKPKRKTSVEEVQRAAQLLLDEQGHRLSREQKRLLRQTVRTGNIISWKFITDLVPPPAGWFPVHRFIRSIAMFNPFLFWMHDLPENSALCDCGGYDLDHS